MYVPLGYHNQFNGKWNDYVFLQKEKKKKENQLWYISISEICLCIIKGQRSIKEVPVLHLEDYVTSKSFWWDFKPRSHFRMTLAVGGT